MISKEKLYSVLCERHGKEVQERFSSACVGIAGLGGLGSNIAIYAARLGIGKLILVDFDTVDISNIHRQQYTLSDIGLQKTKALHKHLMEINPYLDYQLHDVKITPENAVKLFSGCDVVCEAFDKADQKAMLIETLRMKYKDMPIISGSGMAGMDSANKIQTISPFKNMYICGDFQSDISDGLCLMAPRVAVCAAHQATMMMRILLKKYDI